ncbi:MAG: phytanoyl-CoA dioxygenase family protein [Planctomycetaceae bacterium]|nr:phytanoyl-CoA dioxygenase family protein [Planctomycetaceae bacterium]
MSDPAEKSTPAPGFAVIPAREELDSVERTLSFVPLGRPEPQVLSPVQLDQFNREGYLKGFRVLEPTEADDLRAYFDVLLAEATAAGKDSYSLSTVHLAHGRVYDLLSHPAILGPVRDLLGEDVIGWGSHFFCKMPRDGRAVSWHQDATYWPLSPSRTVTVWLAIDQASVENACMSFIPGSHLRGEIPWRPSRPEEENVLDQTVEDVEQYGEPVPVELEAGEISIHSDLLLHSSPANHSDRRRCGLTLRYCAAEVRAGLGWNAKGVVVSGHDAGSHWANPPRPALD